MFGLVRTAVGLALVLVLIWFSASVPLGKHTLFGHIERIWHTEETKDLVEGAKEEAAPTYERIKRGVEKGIEEAQKPRPDRDPE